MNVAQRFVAQEKQEGKLKKLLKEAKKNIADRKPKSNHCWQSLQQLNKNWLKYKSIRGQLRTVDLEQENYRLRKRIRTYEDVISRNNLSYFAKHKGKTREKLMDKIYLFDKFEGG